MHANAGQWTAGMKNIENDYDEHAEHLGNVFWLLFLNATSKPYVFVQDFDKCEN